MLCSTLVSSATCVASCTSNQFFWDTTSGGSCRECTSIEYWTGTQCLPCIGIHAQCYKCQLVSATPTCLSCNNNYRLLSATVCDCVLDRMPNALSVCTLCSVLISNCLYCSVLGVCSTCATGYSWDATNSVCRAQFTFTSNTLTGIAFITDFTIEMVYANAARATPTQIIDYAVYMYDTEAAYLAELPNFLLQTITVGVLY